MSNPKKRTKEEIISRQHELSDQISAIYNTNGAEIRELTADENKQVIPLEREFADNVRELSMMNLEDQARSLQKPEPAKNPNQILRELAQNSREQGPQNREITYATQIKDSGAIALNIHDIIPTLNEGLGLPSTLKIITGVTGNDLYPVGVDDADMEEVGETAALTSQDLNFANITPTPRRVGMTITVSNMAIDNADFDLMAYVNTKFGLALRKYIASKAYSQAAFTGNKGPFSGLAATGTIKLSDKPYQDILLAIAKFGDKGFDTSTMCLVIDCTTEAYLMSTHKQSTDDSGYVIENGKLAGHDYVVSHYINTKLGEDGKTLVKTTDTSIGFAFFEWFAVQQHGQVRLTVDSTSQAVSSKGVTAITVNTAWSMTDISIKINDKDGTGTKAFARYTITLPTA